MVSRGSERQEWWLISKGVFLQGDKNVLEFDNGDGCTILQILKTIEFHTLRR